MLLNFSKGDKIVCNTDNLLIGEHDVATPKKHEIVTVRKVRIYEKIGYCVSLEEYDHEIFFHISGFDEKDLDFANKIIDSIKE